MDKKCKFCNALGYKGENKGNSQRDIHFGNLCCSRGKVELLMFPAHPESLHRLFTESNPLATYFRANIRLFNSGMAMASVKVTEKTVSRHGPASFKVCGQMYRMIGPMLQQEQSTSPACMQTYFHDPEYQATHRAAKRKW